VSDAIPQKKTGIARDVVTLILPETINVKNALKRKTKFVYLQQNQNLTPTGNVDFVNIKIFQGTQNVKSVLNRKSSLMILNGNAKLVALLT
jgi:hypothetical protein